jgi:hypothetical protein
LAQLSSLVGQADFFGERTKVGIEANQKGDKLKSKNMDASFIFLFVMIIVFVTLASKAVMSEHKNVNGKKDSKYRL